MATKQRAIIVPHVHWDRAWYLPFETFRHRLVRMIDRLIELLDSNDDFASFMLDGQTVLLDDYLELRPDRDGDLRRLISAGRLSVGPWYTAPDLFLPSGESIIRNLQMGIRRTRSLGGGAMVGYVPDPFGHPSQMPQIMRRFGIDSYLFMRGMREEWKSHTTLFNWRSPDGSTVVAHFLSQGYFAAAGLGLSATYGRFDGENADAGRATEQVRQAVEALSASDSEAPFLLLNGFDHMPEQAEIPQLLKEIDARLPDLDIRQGSLVDWVDAQMEEAAERPTFAGDLLGQADHPLLASVWSTRMYLKRQNHEAERRLIRYAEPIAAGISGPDVGPFLEHAWKELLMNHAHDDICGCSVDAVHDDDETRFRHVREICDAIITERLESLYDGEDAGLRADERRALLFVFNAHPFEIRQRIEADVHFPIPGGEHAQPLPRANLVAETPDGPRADVDVLEYKPRVMRNRYLEQTWASRYRIAFDAQVPSCGYQIFVVNQRDAGLLADDRSSHSQIDRGSLALSVADGRVVLTDMARSIEIRDLLRLQYVQDSGDTYSFSPVAGDQPRWGRIVETRHIDRHAILLYYVIDVPAGLGAERDVQLRVSIQLRLTPDGAVAIDGHYYNEARDGRLRIMLDTGLATDHVLSDGQFIINRHESIEMVAPEDDPARYAAYPGELPYPTHHQRDFLFASDGDRSFWIANQGLPEYELISGGDRAQVAVTLHRAVEYLSVVGGRIRRSGAGPHVRVPGAQCLREMEFKLAIGLAGADLGSVTRAALPHAHPPLVQELPYLPYRGGISRENLRRSWLSLDNPSIRLSAFRRAEEEQMYVVRLYNPTSNGAEARLQLGFPASAVCESSLLEKWNPSTGRPLPGRVIELSFRPGEIKTLLIRP